ncbi:MAG: hypothetical protein E7616_00070 [Ruminococcaceae bacterium]|nr:hypothetical protein [Oscillospiraceae bacterium]
MKTAKRSLSFVLCLCMVLPLLLVGVSAEDTAPKALENVALGKPVEATSGVGADSITDGNIGTYWDSTSGRQTPDSTVVIDLENWYKLKDVTVINYHADGRYYNFSVSVSTDGTKFTRIGVKDNTTPETAAGTTFECTDASIRYIKVIMTKNSKNPEYHICEVQAMGELDPNYEEPVLTEDPNDPANVAVGKPTRANYNSSLSSRVTDTKLDSTWSGNAYPQYVDVDLLANYDISEIIVYMPNSDQYTFTVYGSLDGVRFDTIAESNVKKESSKTGEVFKFDKPLNYRVIRVNVTSAKMGGKAAVSEIKVHGKQNSTAVIPTRDKLEFVSYDEWLLKNHGVDVSKLKDAQGNYNIEDTYTAKDTIEALQGLVSRVLGDQYNDWFTFEVAPSAKDGYDYFEISGGGSSKVKIKGNDGVAIASGLNHYLKYYCYVNVSQQTKQVAMPASAPKVDGSIYKETLCEVRYAYNYCTLSYTMQFYGFEEWQKELDYLMLSGVNVILDTTASEALWVMFLQQYGYTAQEAIDFVCGYAFKAWWLMGNLENYGGSVGDQWIYDTLEMARVNQRYMTVMGCMPCLNIFAGTLPINFATKADAALTGMGYPDVKKYMTGTGDWCGFVRPYSLNTTFPGFETMSHDFYETQNYLYGQLTDYYAGDFLHEISAGFQLDPAFDKANMSRTVLDYLLDENEEACWIMQSWWENPLPEVVAGFGDDREDHVLMLDLAAAGQQMRWKNTKDYGGYEFGGSGWVFCMLDNYGGRTGMHGAFASVMARVLECYRDGKHFKGIGITPEGTEENPASYDFLWDLVWVSLDDIPSGQTITTYSNQYVKNWVQEYAKRRYGTDSKNIQKAWDILRTSVYGKLTVDGTSTNGIITSNPKIFENGKSGTVAFGGGYYHVPYDEKDLEEALEYMMADFSKLKDKETYIYDICDMMCQVLTNSSTAYLDAMGKAINEKDYNSFVGNKVKYLRCIEVIDEVTSYVDDTMLGNWVGRIDDWVNDKRTGEYADYDIDTMKYNTLILVTTWASHASLVGYANREYSGLMNDYYLKMWREFLNRTDDALVKNSWETPASLSEVYFQYAWDIIVSRGEGYEREVRDPAGNSEMRGLPGIYGEIARKLRKNSPLVVDKLKVVDASSGYTIERNQLRGLKYGVTLKDLKGVIAGSQNTALKALDENGNPMGENEPLVSRCQVLLLDIDGATMDAVTIVGVNPTYGITVSENKLTVEAGLTIQINVTYRGKDPNEVVTMVYTSSDPSIATVDENGLVTGVSEGTAVITITAGEYSQEVTLTVTPGAPKPVKDGSSSPWIMIVTIIIVSVVIIGGAGGILLVKKKK